MARAGARELDTLFGLNSRVSAAFDCVFAGKYAGEDVGPFNWVKSVFEILVRYERAVGVSDLNYPTPVDGDALGRSLCVWHCSEWLFRFCGNLDWLRRVRNRCRGLRKPWRNWSRRG